MVAKATFRSGKPQMVDHTPSSAVAAGDVVLLGNTTGLTCGVAHSDIPANELGALAVGGGIYDMVNLNNAANYAKVWWDGTSKVTTTSTNNALFGFVVSGGGGGANTTCQVLHRPFV